MRRVIGLIAALTLAGYAAAQAPFTIVRPAEGARVREVVKFLFPKNSIPERGYVGIWVNGKFLQALVPSTSGEYAVFMLDSKKLQLPDGDLNVEAVLYEDLEQRSVIRDRTSVKLTLDNSSSIKVPANGILLRYKFTPGTEYIYRVESRDSVSSISEAQVTRGSRAAELPLDAERYRYLVAVDNVYKTAKGRDALVRMQMLPKAGQIRYSDGLVTPFDYAIISLPDGKRRVYANEMASMYLRITDTGREVFGGASPAWPMEGSQGGGATSHIFAAMPLPVLPEKRVSPGDSWQGPIVAGLVPESKLYSSRKMSFAIPARGDLLGVEWQDGVPCAKIKMSLSLGEATRQGAELARLGREFTDTKIELEEIVWFALDRGIPVRIELNLTQDIRSDQVPNLGGFLNRGQGNQGGDAPRGLGMAPGDEDGGGFFMRTMSGAGQDQELGGRRGGRLGGSQEDQGGGSPQGGAGRQPRTGGGGFNQGGQQFVRIRMQQLYVLEK